MLKAFGFCVFGDDILEALKYGINSSLKYIKSLLKWILVSILVGFIGGLVGSLFHISIDAVTNLRMENTWLIFFLPFGGLLITASYELFKKEGKIDTNRVIESVRSSKSIPLIMAPLIFFGTVVTHLFGGSAGREGAALQLGGSIGYNLGKGFKFNEDDMHIVVMSGMSSVFAALFGTPLTAAFFSLEVISVGVMHYAGLVPCIVSAITASQIALFFGISPVCFKFTNMQTLSADVLIKAIILAVLCAVVSIIFCLAIKYCEHYSKKFFKNRYIRTFVGGTLIVLLSLLFGTYDYNGAGMEIISRAINGTARPEAFLIKILFTVITISAGFRGGEIVPTFFIGSTFGCVIGGILGLNPGFGAALGFVALFCGVVNCPVASVILALEVFGGDSIIVFAAVCAVSYMMSGYFGLYKSQKIVYSKLDEQYIDINTK